MDWGFIGTLLAIIFFITTIITTVILALKFAKKKQPVWANQTTKIIGLGTNAPAELKLTFNSKPVNDVYQTTFILFNKGKEAIRKDDVTESVTIHFKGAEILRQPIIKAKSKEAIELSAKQVVKDGDNSIELGFLYLDHEDGAVVEVIHTVSERISCVGNIIGVKEIVNIGEFETSPLPLLGIRLVALLIPIGAISWLLFRDFPYGLIGYFMIAVLGILILTFIPDIRLLYFRYRRFPNWSRYIRTKRAFITEEALIKEGASIKAYCFRCRTKIAIRNPRSVTLKNGRLAIRGVCPDCGTKVFRLLL